MKHYDFICLGGGSAGFNAARTASSLGKNVAVVDGFDPLGGLCILRGCMPSKTLLYSAEVLHQARQAKKIGVLVSGVRPDMKAIQARKKFIISKFTADRVKSLTNGIFTLYRAYARFIDPHTIELSNGEKLCGKHFLIGTGSKVSVPAVPGLHETPFWTSDEVLDLDFVPRSVAVLGGGTVACELAQYLERIGSKVTLIQRSNHLLRGYSKAAQQVVETAFRDEGIKVFTGTSLKKIFQTKRGIKIEFEHEGKLLVYSADYLFSALGREPNTATLNLDAAGVKTRPNGQIVINRWQQTSTAHIYAAGDCSGPVEIVHIAIEQGMLAARHASGIKGLKPLDWSQLLTVVFTDPQLAGIGKTEPELKEEGRDFLSASYPFNDHGKSILMEANYGFVKVLADPKRGRLLGAEIVSKDAGELIHAFSLAFSRKTSVFDLLRAPWYHPTLAEIITYPLEEIAEKISTT